MNKFNTTAHVLFSITCALIIQSKSYAEPANLSQLKETIKTYHDSGAYQKELSEAIAPASRYIVERAELNDKSAKPEKLAIVLDIDETSVTNYNTIRSRDFSDDKQKVYQAWNAADAPAIKPMLSLYNIAQKEHVAVFFVTGREASFKKPTDKNLQLAGYQQWAGLYLKPNDYKQPSIAPFKTQARADITKKGYTIIASIGDQNSDLIGGYAEKTFKLPNPYYFVP